MKKILGLANAINYFLGDMKDRNITNEESFFLVERLSNVTSTVNQSRINLLLSIISIPVNRDSLLNIYKKNIDNGKLK